MDIRKFSLVAAKRPHPSRAKGRSPPSPEGKGQDIEFVASPLEKLSAEAPWRRRTDEVPFLAASERLSRWA